MGKSRKGETARDSDNDDDELPPKRPRTSKMAAGDFASFACPFAKRNPLKYRSCYAYVLKRIRDVKQHLSRYHQLPLYCPRCTCTFETEDNRDEHIRTCTDLIEHTVIHEGVTRAQKILLGQRVSSKMKQTDQWFEIFDILFPGHSPRPKSAYMNAELTVELEAFQDLMYAEGPRIISSVIRSRGLDSSTVEQLEDNSAALLESAIQDGLQEVFEQWAANVPNDSHLSTSSRLTPANLSLEFPIISDLQGSESCRPTSDTLHEEAQEADLVTPQEPFSESYEVHQNGDYQLRTSKSPTRTPSCSA